uniref:Uncharacterized protein n=1 Tax=Monodelphis domestica TaxID=13616 RepID=H9H5X6_MONDO
MDDSKVVGGKVKKAGKHVGKAARIHLKAKLERCQQSARERRAKKKPRYRYLEELVSREELEMSKHWCMAHDKVYKALKNILISTRY